MNKNHVSTRVAEGLSSTRLYVCRACQTLGKICC